MSLRELARVSGIEASNLSSLANIQRENLFGIY